MLQCVQTQMNRVTALRRRAALATALATLFAAPVANAFEIDTGNPDITMRWDNTLRYNLGVRAQGQNSQILGNPNYDDGDRNFSNGSVVTNRLDLLSEFDVVFQRKYGFRASYAAWWDAAYNNLDDTNNVTAMVTMGSGGSQTGIVCMPVMYGVRKSDTIHAKNSPNRTPKPAAGSTFQSLPQSRMKIATPINQINIG